MTKPFSVKNERKADFPINPIFLKRWSPRSLRSDVSEKELMGLFEAARWAPSSSNEQPWRFLYAKNGSYEWNDFFDLLDDFNKLWCKNAAYLLVLISRNTYMKKKDEKNEDCIEKPNKTHSLDSGSAWMSLALQGRENNLIAHAMAGFDYEKARTLLSIPSTHTIECMIAIGKEGEIEKSIPQRMQKSEVPNSRKRVREFIYHGKFPLNDWK